MRETLIPHPFYPITASAAGVAALVRAGARFIQLRIKDGTPDGFAAEIASALAYCAAHGAVLVVNDHWKLAIEFKAPWLHLGQEDLDGADLGAIRAAGIKLGISTHDAPELARALAHAPDYIALGPIFATRSKVVGHAPQGLAKISAWKAQIAPLPLVAIGGITVENAPACLEAGADGLAILSALSEAPDIAAISARFIAVTAAVAQK
jgi:thiamine-phosphate pyrophosphorylase